MGGTSIIRHMASSGANAILKPLGLRLQRSPQGDAMSSIKSPPLPMKHLENCRVLPDRHEMLRQLPSGGVAAEAGVAFGDFSDAILRLNRPAKLHLIDWWEGARFKPGLERVRDRFKAEIDSGSVVVHRGRSVETLEGFPDASLDWVYIDTDHSYEVTLAELTVCAKKVKPSGHIAGHDFSRGHPVSGIRYGVIPACHHFCVENGWQFEYLTVEHEIMFSFCLMRL